MIPPPITIPGRIVPRDIPSPAVSLPSMTEDPSSPRSYTRRDSIQIHTPVFPPHFTSESMVRSTSAGSARSEGYTQYRPEVVQRNTSPKVTSTASNSRSLPGINDLFSSAPVARELGYLINNRPPPPPPSQAVRSPLEQVLRSPLEQVIRSPLENRSLRLPSFSNLNRGHWKRRIGCFFTTTGSLGNLGQNDDWIGYWTRHEWILRMIPPPSPSGVGFKWYWRKKDVGLAERDLLSPTLSWGFWKAISQTTAPHIT